MVIHNKSKETWINIYFGTKLSWLLKFIKFWNASWYSLCTWMNWQKGCKLTYLNCFSIQHLTVLYNKTVYSIHPVFKMYSVIIVRVVVALNLLNHTQKGQFWRMCVVCCVQFSVWILHCAMHLVWYSVFSTICSVKITVCSNLFCKQGNLLDPN